MLIWHGDRTPVRFCKNREVQGPAPYSTGIIAKPIKNPPLETLLKERRKKEDDLIIAMRAVKEDHRLRSLTTWVDYTNDKFEKNYVQDRVNETLNNEEVHLDKKRTRLRDLMVKDEDDYEKEMKALTETPEQRYERMKARATMLKSKREAERLKVVEEKRKQQWKNKCEEVRPILSRRQTVEVFRGRDEQVAMKALKEQRKKETEAMYADMWAKDRLAKCAREERQEQIRVQRNEIQLKDLAIQCAAKEAKKIYGVREKEEELKLINEEHAIIKLEKERDYRIKKRNQNRTRTQLENMMRYKAKREAVELQEELALDMKILEQVLIETNNEKLEQREQKEQFRQETLQYLDYLKKQAAFEAAREKEIDLMLDTEVKAMWAKRIEQYKLEKESRDKLMKEVVEVRKLQIAEKLAEVAREKEEVKRDRIQMGKMIEEHLKDEDNRLRRVFLKNQKHAQDLKSQMKFEEEIALQNKLEERREYEDGLREEAEFQEKMKEILLEADYDKRHPLRENMKLEKSWRWPKEQNK